MGFEKEYMSICKQYEPLIEEYDQLSKEYANKRDCAKSEKHNTLQNLAEKHAKYSIGQLFTEDNYVWKIVRLQSASSFNDKQIYIEYYLVMIGCTGKEIAGMHSKRMSESELEKWQPVSTIKEVNIIPQTIIIKEIRCIKESKEMDNNPYLIKDKSNRLFTFNYGKINDLTKVTKLQRSKHSVRYQLYEKTWGNKSRSRWVAPNLKQITKEDIPDLTAELI